MLNRTLLVVKLRQPFIDWVNAADPRPQGSRVTLDDANADATGFLIHEDACEELEDWLQQCYLLLFEGILGEWYVDPKLWPQDRTLELFKTWCEVELHSMIFDLIDGPLLDDDFEET
jgi:hypothetical protein